MSARSPELPPPRRCGSSLSTNIVEASCKALLEVINRIEQSQGGARAALAAKSAV